MLIALFDPAHIHHDAAHRWFSAHRADGWATCPMTENGFVRVLSNPAYPGRRTTVPDAVARLRTLTAAEDQVFWPDEISLLEPGTVDPSRLGGHRMITDAYLVALAVANAGKVASFDRALPTGAVPGASDVTVSLLV